MALPNNPSPIEPAAETNPLGDLFDTVNTIGTTVADIGQRLSAVEKAPTVAGGINAGEAIINDLIAVFGHLGLGVPSSAATLLQSGETEAKKLFAEL